MDEPEAGFAGDVAKAGFGNFGFELFGSDRRAPLREPNRPDVGPVSQKPDNTNDKESDQL